MSFLPQVAVFLIAACLAVPLSRKSGFGSVLGYLVAGVVIGPWCLKLITDVPTILQFSEIGVVLLLFIIGLELQPSRLWVMRQTVFGMGALQVGVTSLLLAAGAYWWGLGPVPALVAGFGLSLSSTAFVLQMLGEKKQLALAHGRASFGILLFQDVAAIPVLALLGILYGDGDTQHAHIGMKLLIIAGVLTVLALGNRVVLRFLFRLVTQFGNPEIFTASALLIVIGAGLVANSIGLSMGLGAFLAGVLLADSSYRHEFEANIEPFKGLLLGLFFMAVGMSVNLGLIVEAPLTVFAVLVALLTIKMAALYGIGKLFRLPGDSARNLAFVLPAGGEFAFVMFGAAADYKLFDRHLADLLNLAVTLSMAATPFLVLFNEKVVQHFLEQRKEPEFDRIDEPANPVIIAGMGRFGQIVGRLLRMQQIPFTALEADSAQIETLRRFGSKVYYGDASRLELLTAAKAGESKFLVLAIDGIEASVRAAEMARKHFPNLTVLARARNRHHAHLLREQGVQVVVRETFYSSLWLSEQLLEQLGMQKPAIEHLVAMFEDFDHTLLEKQYAVFRDDEKLVQTSKDAAEELEQLLEEDRKQAAG
ncbi:MAG TPA: monovalent cation:proton antiporter-2 (CPA2) family protein [Gammaproteobacteria bacterium]|jgi:glutathione-regulated potassium-efflux system ancillary protein KefC/glutathione-regulated potassium-efflux system protein KefB|nr:monovalent cation:proton antiporter-2 (CPA2) family protein [Gammaproteobacteria bacterium]